MSDQASLSGKWFKSKTRSMLLISKATASSTPHVKAIIRLELKSTMKKMGYDSRNHTIYQVICDLEAEGSGNIHF